MLKNLTSNQLLLIALAAVLFLMAAFSFFLLQDPSAPLPFAPRPDTATSTLPQPSQTLIPSPSFTPKPTRQTSYTPFSTLLTPASLNPSTTGSPGGGTTTPNSSTTVMPGEATSTKSATVIPSLTSSTTFSPKTQTITPSPTITDTLSPGYTGVTGRVVQNGTPVSSVIVEFKDDVDPRQSATNLSGHYWFTTLAPGTTFSLTFKQSANPQLTPVAEIASLAKIQGALPTGVNIIDLPDFDISLIQNDMQFELQSPMDGSTYEASVINSSNKIPFGWSLYGLGGSYHIELGLNGSDQSLWTSDQIASTNFEWDGTLDDGTHISPGIYWWRVGVTKSLGSYVVVIFTQPWDLIFTQ